MISQLVGGGTRGWLNSEEQARFWCFQHQVGTDQDQVQLRTYPRIGCFRHQVGTPWCSRQWDVRTGYTATQCHFPPGLQLGTLLVRYLLHQSRNMHWNKMKSRYWHAIFFKLTGIANPMTPTKTAITLHACCLGRTGSIQTRQLIICAVAIKMVHILVIVLVL